MQDKNAAAAPIKLSIGTAVYNLDESFLRAHIESVVRQLTDETELLLIDDCSTNNSGAVCREYTAADSRVRYIRMEQNGGLSRVRNRTIQESAGKWIFFADGDDLLSDHFVETALRFYDADYDIIILDRLKFLDRKDDEQPCTVSTLTALPPEAGRALSISCLCLDPAPGEALGLSSRAFYHAAWGALYNRDFLLRNDLLFPAGQKKAQDSVFNTQAYHAAGRIAYLPYVMYFYRNNAQGITRRYSADFAAMAASLLGHLQNCIDTLYPADAEVETCFRNHRVMSLAVDELRLNLFHKDNPNDRKTRKREFLAFVDTEPYKSAIQRFDARESGRWEWRLPAVLMRKKRFAALDLFVGDPVAFGRLCGADKRLAKLLNKGR